MKKDKDTSKIERNYNNILEMINDDSEIDYGKRRICEYPDCGTILHHMNNEDEKYCYVCNLKVLIDNDIKYPQHVSKNINYVPKKRKTNVQSRTEKREVKGEPPMDGSSEVQKQ